MCSIIPGSKVNASSLPFFGLRIFSSSWDNGYDVSLAPPPDTYELPASDGILLFPKRSKACNIASYHHSLRANQECNRE